MIASLDRNGQPAVDCVTYREITNMTREQYKIHCETLKVLFDFHQGLSQKFVLGWYKILILTVFHNT